MVRVLICGSRYWGKPIPIDVVVSGLVSIYGPDGVTVIHGGARGADELAGDAAQRHHCHVEVFNADWAGQGKAAGPLRNQRMIDESKPDVVFAFTHDLETSRGTADMVRRAHAASVPTYVVTRA